MVTAKEKIATCPSCSLTPRVLVCIRLTTWKEKPEGSLAALSCLKVPPTAPPLPILTTIFYLPANTILLEYGTTLSQYR